MEPAWLSVFRTGADTLGTCPICRSRTDTQFLQQDFSFRLSYGIQGQYRISKWVSAVLEFSGTTTSQNFDGYGRTNRLGDHMVSLTAGFTFHLGKTGWKRAADVTHYIHRNEQLIDYSRALSEKNSR